ncbi:MAG: biotin--[acetyl-CoA-carboxylase] ligase [Synergistaceae bacterium]|jgi:BirA family biotin operon repressor/biotin-[acetyl-CoA-carboxylase] ligase|nr:biotin--[acetyl-CoA-carboxylase] ligase [Synergistaceae bacterium]
MPDLEKICARLTEALGGDAVVECHETLASTQTRAREIARQRGTLTRGVVVAGEQTEGRGRLKRRWESPVGSGIYFSVFFRPSLPPSETHLVNLAAALAVEEAARALLGADLTLKWPNDLLISRFENGGKTEAKVCGILSESAFQGASLAYCVTGIGLNLYEPRECAAARGWLCGEGREIDEADLLARIVSDFFGRVDAMERGGSAGVLETYRGKCASVGRTVTVETGGEKLSGICSGIGGEGELILDTPEGERRFHAADVTHAHLSEWT